MLYSGNNSAVEQPLQADATEQAIDDAAVLIDVVTPTGVQQHKRTRVMPDGDEIVVGPETALLLRQMKQLSADMLAAHSKAIGHADERCGALSNRIDSAAAEAAVQADLIERHKRDSDVTIRGVLLHGREVLSDLRDIVKRIGAALNCDLSDRDIVHVYVVRAQVGDKRDPLLVVRFGSLGCRSLFFSHYMEKNGLTTQCLGYSNGNRIYISDNLTRRNSLVRNRAVALKREGRLKAFTVRDGLIHVTRNGEELRCKHPVHSVEELDEYVRVTVYVPPGQLSAGTSLANNIGSMALSRPH